MPVLLTRLRAYVDNLSLPLTLTLALSVGLALPLGAAAWLHLTEQRAALLARLEADHSRILEVLALGMQIPLWEIRPEAGKPLIDALMLDQRITTIEVASPLAPDFLGARAPERRLGQEQILERPVLRDGELIGQVRVAMDTGQLASRLAEQWLDIAVSGLLQFFTGMVIIFALLRYKVLGPLQRLVSQARVLAAGALDHPLAWSRGDELGELGRSFEETRRALRALVADLAQRNRELEAREAELGRQAVVLRAALDNMSDGITLVDADLRLVAWNRRFTEIMSLPEDLVRPGISIQELPRLQANHQGYTQAERAALLDPLRDSFRPGESSTVQTRLHDGRLIEIRRRPVPEGGFVSTYTDVTEALEARRRADENRHLLEAVMDAVPAMIHVKDRQLRYRMVNRQFLEHWRLGREGFLGRTSGELFPPHIHRLVEVEDRKVLDTGRPSPFYEFEHLDEHGQKVTIWATKVPLLGPDGEVTHIVTVDIDISEHRRAEQERQRWLQLFQDAIESLPDGFAIYDAQERLVNCNQAFADLFGATADSLKGATATALYRRAWPLIETVNGRPPEETRRPNHFPPPRGGESLEIHLKDGRWLLSSYHPTAEGGMVFVRADITRLKLAEQEISRQREALHQSEKLSALGSLLAGVAHELNNPLSVVVGRSIMLESQAQDGTLRDRLGKIRQAAERCARIVKTFLAVARQQPPQRAQVHLNTLIENAVEMVDYGLRTANVEVTMDLDPDLPELSVDADQITQVFTNLLVNARQALEEVPEPRRLEIASRYLAEAGLVQLTFSDNGPGIPPDIRPRIFEPFYTSKPTGVGTGIGLSFSHGVITSHGGRIHLEDRAGPGARFVIQLPVEPPRDKPAEPCPENGRSRSRGRTVLVVDDEAEIAELLREVLEREGYAVDLAASGNEALERLETGTYDLIVSDLKMPDLDGPGLYRRLAERGPALLERLVFITGDTLGAGTKEFLAHCRRPVIEKPFVPRDIVRLLDEVLEGNWRPEGD